MKNIKKLTAVIFTLSLLATLFSISSSAFTNPEIYSDEYVEWEISPDGTTIRANGMYGEEVIYTAYADLSVGYRIEYSLFEYENMLVSSDGDYYSIYSSHYGDQVIYVAGENELYAYSTANGAAALNGYFTEDENAVMCKLVDYGKSSYAPIGYNIAKMILDYQGETVSVNVTDLANKTCYSLIYSDSNEILTRTKGAIYLFSDGMYFVNYDNLSNSYFDADGNFSYRSGTVNLTKLDGNALTAVESLLENSNYYSDHYDYEYNYVEGESDFSDISFNAESARAFLIAVSIIVGIVLPGIPFVIFVIRIIRKRAKEAVTDIVIASASLIWIAIGITLLILFL